MRKRINIILPEETVHLIDRVAPKGERSAFIKVAVEEYVRKNGRTKLRKRLREGAAAEAELDLKLAEVWFNLEEESCPEAKE